MKGPLRGYTLLLKWSGLSHNWSMFAPNPLSSNRLIGFELEFENGKIIPWRLEEFGVRDEYQYVFYTRFFRMHNELLKTDNKLLHESICNFVLKAYQLKKRDSILPAKIHILRFQEAENVDIRTYFPWLSTRIFTFKVDKEESFD